jgi:hypothetical protein
LMNLLLFLVSYLVSQFCDAAACTSAET